MTSMNRPAAISLLAIAGAATLAACLFAGLVYASGRRADIAVTDRALAALRREARAPRAVETRAATTARICPEGAEGLAVAARRGLDLPVLDKSGAIDPTAIAAISNGAIAASRYLERARAAPALPQRLGRQLGKDGKWTAIEPEAIGCATVPVARDP